jgi:hypothetical protein
MKIKAKLIDDLEKLYQLREIIAEGMVELRGYEVTCIAEGEHSHYFNVCKDHVVIAAYECWKWNPELRRVSFKEYLWSLHELLKNTFGTHKEYEVLPVEETEDTYHFKMKKNGEVVLHYEAIKRA